jgi:hypothetical protein
MHGHPAGSGWAGGASRMNNFEEAREERLERGLSVVERTNRDDSMAYRQSLYAEMIWQTLEAVNENLARIADVLERGANR